MTKTDQFHGALKGLKVLELTDAKGIYCGKLLADLGAEVTKIEPPGGHPARNIGPFYHNDVEPEKSLYWFHYNTNKRSITLNIESAEGRDILKSMIKTSDIFVETFPPGDLDEMGLAYETLRELNPGLIQTSITAFGQTGPWRNYKASDIVGSATGGLSYICGWPDLPPLQMPGSQAYHQVSIQAAVGTLIALYHRMKTGKGQRIDAAMHRAVVASLMTTSQRYFLFGEIRKRNGNDHELPHFGLFACQDGYVDFRFRDDRWGALVEWLDSEGKAEDLKEKKWQDPLYRQKNEAIRHINRIVQHFLSSYTKKYIYEEGQKRGLEIGAVYTGEDVSKDPQLAATGFFRTVEHPELKDKLTYMGPPYRLSETPWRIRTRAPLIGEHNETVYEKELGFTKKEINILRKKGII